MISCEPQPPQVRTEFKATLCWISEQKLHLNQRYTLRHTTKTVRAIIGEINHRRNVNTLECESPISELQTNDIGQVRIKTLQPVVCDPYSVNRQTGGFVLIDENNGTVAAGRSGREKRLRPGAKQRRIGVKILEVIDGTLLHGLQQRNVVHI